MGSRENARQGTHTSRKRNLYGGFCCVILYAIFSVSSLQPMVDVTVSQEGYNAKHLARNKLFPVRFVLFLGLEGTGHHFWQSLIKESPSYENLRELKVHPQYTKNLTRNLYRHKKKRWKGIWSATCNWEDTDPAPNVTAIHEELVTTLRAIDTHVETKRVGDKNNRTPLLVPVNFLGGGNEFGVMSYPSFLLPCRTLSYPNLFVWYQACAAAGVLCQHVYVFRNPHSVIKSTTENRLFNKNKLEAIHLYTTQLHLLHSQLLAFPDRLVGCWNYDAALSSEHWKEEIDPLLEFNEEKSFGNVLKTVYRPRKPLTESEKKALVPSEINAYMDSMTQLHKILQITCKSLKHKIR